VYQKAPRNWGKNITLLASITKEEGMGPCLTVEGATTKEVFETYNIEQGLAPTLRDGQVVVMDNLNSHKGERVKELVEGRGCELIYLPPYSPDLNPIEQAFSKIKNLLREARARAYEALVEAIGKALSAIAPWDSRGFFEHCGYHVMVQSL
jgi:transposase